MATVQEEVEAVERAIRQGRGDEPEPAQVEDEDRELVITLPPSFYSAHRVEPGTPLEDGLLRAKLLYHSARHDLQNGGKDCQREIRELREGRGWNNLKTAVQDQRIEEVRQKHAQAAAGLVTEARNLLKTQADALYSEAYPAPAAGPTDPVERQTIALEAIERRNRVADLAAELETRLVGKNPEQGADVLVAAMEAAANANDSERADATLKVSRAWYTAGKLPARVFKSIERATEDPERAERLRTLSAQERAIYKLLAEDPKAVRVINGFSDALPLEDLDQDAEPGSANYFPGWRLQASGGA